MSYESQSELPSGISLRRVHELLRLLGYDRLRNPPEDLRLGQLAHYLWFKQDEYQSFCGVQVSILRKYDNSLIVSTRTTAGRSYWDLTHQNRTIKLLRDHFGGRFETDEGRGRYLRPGGPPPLPVASGCGLARWGFKKSIVNVRLYLSFRTFSGPMGENPTKFDPSNEHNVRILSNNMILPYLVGAWEEYFRATFAACFKYSEDRGDILRRIKPTAETFKEHAEGKQSFERAVAEHLPFQHPNAIGDNFHKINPKLHVGGALKKTYSGRNVSPHDSICNLIELRNEVVHTGRLDLTLFDEKLRAAISHFEVAVERAYVCIAKHFDFEPQSDSWGAR